MLPLLQCTSACDFEKSLGFNTNFKIIATLAFLFGRKRTLANSAIFTEYRICKQLRGLTRSLKIISNGAIRSKHMISYSFFITLYPSYTVFKTLTLEFYQGIWSQKTSPPSLPHPPSLRVSLAAFLLVLTALGGFALTLPALLTVSGW